MTHIHNRLDTELLHQCYIHAQTYHHRATLFWMSKITIQKEEESYKQKRNPEIKPRVAKQAEEHLRAREKCQDIQSPQSDTSLLLFLCSSNEELHFMEGTAI